jgi:hypothetical protein
MDTLPNPDSFYRDWTRRLMNDKTDTLDAIAREIRQIAASVGAPIETRRTRKDEERWAAQLNDIAFRVDALSNHGEGEFRRACPVRRQEAEALFDAVQNGQSRDYFAVEGANALAAEFGMTCRITDPAPAEADRRDAERYRAIRNGEWCDLYYLHEGENHKHDPLSRSANERLDAACDAATQEQT